MKEPEYKLIAEKATAYPNNYASYIRGWIFASPWPNHIRQQVADLALLYTIQLLQSEEHHATTNHV